jgi:hypothetical protein
VRDHSDFDPFEESIDVFTGTKRFNSDAPTIRTNIAIAFCNTNASGALEKIEGIDEIARLESYHSHHLELSALTPVVRPTTDASNCPLSVWLRNESMSRLLNDVAATHTLFRIAVREP